ncbi:peptidyl-tRNA hydrolase, partial [Anncaliia algerae PRA109]
SQACHATSEVILKTDKYILQEWLRDGQPKIVVKANRLEMINIINECNSRKLPIHFIYDAGRTEVLPGSNTVIAIGPETKEILDHVTGKLKLL